MQTTTVLDCATWCIMAKKDLDKEELQYCIHGLYSVYISDSEYHVWVYWRQKVLQDVFLLYFQDTICIQDFKLSFEIRADGDK